MPSKLPRFTIRVDKELMKKFRYVADYNGRSANREIEILIKKHVSEFEEKINLITPEQYEKFDK
ncbi:Arc family DNA-binding protein [Acetobacterium sp.]|uniref:Arc family DNA-binding protein n=1 Tax=Acetobacterium sp. TaxID=1872094 RepID=UPI00271DDE0F|nr:Arc family DNA-binding protein [Acetobacterium sp.]MDO9491273.1 Arc family DNA-binding protein [Acetobacterium sp.]